MGLGTLSGIRNTLADYSASLEIMLPWDAFEMCPGHEYRFRGLADSRHDHRCFAHVTRPGPVKFSTFWRLRPIFPYGKPSSDSLGLVAGVACPGFICVVRWPKPLPIWRTSTRIARHWSENPGLRSSKRSCRSGRIVHDRSRARRGRRASCRGERTLRPARRGQLTKSAASSGISSTMRPIDVPAATSASAAGASRNGRTSETSGSIPNRSTVSHSSR